MRFLKWHACRISIHKTLMAIAIVIEFGCTPQTTRLMFSKCRPAEAQRILGCAR